MCGAIILEHTRGFRKALRKTSHLLNLSLDGVAFDVNKDVLQGNMVPSNNVLAGSYPNEDEVVAPSEEPSTEIIDDAKVVNEVPNIV